MDCSRFKAGPAAVFALLAVALALPAPGAAQQPDFLFHTPKVSMTVRLGYAVPTASSDIFNFTQEQLTLSRSDFNSVAWGGQVALRASDRMDVAFDLGYSRSKAPSEYRDWVDNNDLPIEQTTEFQRIPVTVGVKAYLRERGRSVGRFAWIPTQWAPYVGAGVGYMWYRFEQNGDWVDFQDLGVFPDRYVSDGKAPMGALFGGADWSLGPSFYLNLEGRYSWAKADMSTDFQNFNRMDLSGFQATAGIAVRF